MLCQKMNMKNVFNGGPEVQKARDSLPGFIERRVMLSIYKPSVDTNLLTISPYFGSQQKIPLRSGKGFAGVFPRKLRGCAYS